MTRRAAPLEVPPAAELLAPLGPWFDGHRRDLPWRARDLSVPHPDPWAVLVSELMLQQTQVGTVIPYFERWLAAFPTPAALAGAPESEVLHLWQGLGYYRRARNLQQAARAIQARGWPREAVHLRRLPGVGPYTAAAVAAIAFQEPEPALDGNALRVAARLLALADPLPLAAALRDWLRPALVALGPSRATQAVMEFGALVCLPRSPRCDACPLAGACAARLQDRIAACPAPRRRPVAKEVPLRLVAVEAGGAWLLRRPVASGLLSGLWRWPALEPGPASVEGTAPGLRSACRAPGWVQVYTHRREVVEPVLLRVAEPFPAGPGHAWVPEADLPGLAMGRRDQRLRTLALAGPADGPPGPWAAALLAELRARG